MHILPFQPALNTLPRMSDYHDCHRHMIDITQASPSNGCTLKVTHRESCPAHYPGNGSDFGLRASEYAKQLDRADLDAGLARSAQEGLKQNSYPLGLIDLPGVLGTRLPPAMHQTASIIC